MRLEQVRQELQLHAVGSQDVSGSGLADVLYRNDGDTSAADLEAVWLDIAQLFQALQPEASAWQQHGIPVEFAYPVAEITAKLARHVVPSADDQVRPRTALLGWRIASAWEALVAGDIEDVEEHVRLEEWASQLHT